MLKQLNAGIVSFGLMSTMTAPVMAQDAFSTSTKTNSLPTNNLLVEEYSNLYTSVPQVESELDNFAVKNTLSFSHIPLEEESESVASENFDLLSQRRRTRSRSKYKYSAGLDFINFGWVNDENGAINSVLGFNLALGIGYRKYFKPTRDGRFNFNLTLATYFLIIPTVAVGADYQWEEGWYLGLGVGVIPFFFDDFFILPYPYVVGGYRWE